MNASACGVRARSARKREADLPPPVTRSGERQSPRIRVGRAVVRFYDLRMMRLFSIYPTGRPGIALMLLRISLALVLTQATARGMAVAEPSWTTVVPWSVAAAVLVGLGTTLVAGVATLLLVVASLTSERPCDWSNLCALLDAVAVMLLGPGVWSLDARCSRGR